MAKISELSDQDLQTQLVKFTQLLSKADNDSDQLKYKKFQSAIQAEITSRKKNEEETLTDFEEFGEEEDETVSTPAPTKKVGKSPMGKKPGKSIGGGPKKGKVGAKKVGGGSRPASPPRERKPVEKQESGKSKMPLFIGLGVLVLIAAGAATYFLVLKKDSTAEVSVEEVGVAAEPTDAVQAASVDGSDETATSEDSSMGAEDSSEDSSTSTETTTPE